MQLQITVADRSFTIPVSYRHYLQGMIYRMLDADPEYAARLHTMENAAGDKTIKGFTFSPFGGKYLIENKRITFQGSNTLEFRSLDERFIRTLHDSMQRAGEIQCGEVTLPILDMKVIDRHIEDVTEVMVRMRSPVVAYSTKQHGHTVFYTPQEQAFYTAIVENAARKWQKWGGAEPFSLQITRLEHTACKRVFDVFKQTYISGYLASFQLTAPAAVLDMLYQAGLGVKNSEGFGMFDLL